jgi:putative transposase
MTKTTEASAILLLACEAGFDPIEDRLCANIRGTIEAVFNEELDSFLGRLRYGREAGAVKGYRHGNRDRQLIGTFGAGTISVPGPSACRAPGLKTKPARSANGAPRRGHVTRG